jgi:hypothetical protein
MTTAASAPQDDEPPKPAEVATSASGNTVIQINSDPAGVSVAASSVGSSVAVHSSGFMSVSPSEAIDDGAAPSKTVVPTTPTANVHTSIGTGTATIIGQGLLKIVVAQPPSADSSGAPGSVMVEIGDAFAAITTSHDLTTLLHALCKAGRTAFGNHAGLFVEVI